MKVLISDPLATEGVAILKEAGLDVVEQAGLAPDALRQALADCDALIVRSGTQVTGAVLEGANRLKVIGRAGAGVDNIDVPAASRRGILVMNTPGGNTISACELTMALMLAVARRIPQASARVRAGEWPRKGLMGTELRGKRLGIVGLGRIGSEVARRALAFGMTVVGFDPYITEERAKRLEVKLVPLDELLATSDVVTLHTPKSQETERLLDAAALAKMKHGVILINCARGGLIDEAALAEALKSGQVAGCGLDVFDTEPPKANPLLAFDQVVATPHLGATTREAQTNVAIEIAHQVVEVLRGEPARNAVNAPAVDADLLELIGPYIDLCERLGRLISQLAKGPISRLSVTYHGEMNTRDFRPLTTALLKGLLERTLTRRVNYVNAPLIAAERGIVVAVTESSELEDFTNLIAVEARTGAATFSVAATLFSRHLPRIVRLDTYHVDVAPEGHLLVIRNQDRPGAVAHVSAVLARRGVNIADMTCGRDRPGGTAMLVISIDAAVAPDVLREIESSPIILRAQLVSV